MFTTNTNINKKYKINNRNLVRPEGRNPFLTGYSYRRTKILVEAADMCMHMQLYRFFTVFTLFRLGLTRTGQFAIFFKFFRLFSPLAVLATPYTDSVNHDAVDQIQEPNSEKFPDDITQPNTIQPGPTIPDSNIPPITTTAEPKSKDFLTHMAETGDYISSHWDEIMVGLCIVVVVGVFVSFYVYQSGYYSCSPTAAPSNNNNFKLPELNEEDIDLYPLVNKRSLRLANQALNNNNNNNTDLVDLSEWTEPVVTPIVSSIANTTPITQQVADIIVSNGPPPIL
jgi:uncharacterized protein (UPF0333 family)